MNRSRRVLLGVGWLGIVFLAKVLSADDVTRHRPNIVLILADDLGYGDIGCYNPESTIPTPNIDRLAREGMRFTDAHSPSTVCTPTRYSLLTGQMAFRNGMRGVFDGAGGPCLIEEGRLTIGSLLQGYGYTTALFGKWHVGLTFFDEAGQPITQNGLKAVQRIDYSRTIPDSPIHRGFDQFFGTACCPTTDWLYAFIEGDRIPIPPVEKLDRSRLPQHAYSRDNRAGMIAPGFDLEEVDQIFLAKSIQFLRKHAEQAERRPFFLLHSTQAVHLPSFPGKDFQGKTRSGPHADFIFELDAVVGALLDELDKLSLSDDTLVIVTSDNGPEVGTVVAMRRDHDHDGARPWRGMKRDQWEGGHRVPFVARWPNHVAPGSQSDATICLTDILATCADIVGAHLPHNAGEDSISFLPLLRGVKDDAPREYTLHQTISLALAIRKGPWKYLDHQGSGGNNYEREQLLPFVLPESDPDAPAQLYNLSQDPGETTNLYSRHPEIVAELKEKLDAFQAAGRSAPLER